MDRPLIKQGFGCCAPAAGIGSLLLLIALMIGGCVPEVWPVVPVPDPINPPVPVVPVPSGSERIVLILHESHDQTPELARLKVELQGGHAAKFFVAGRHSVFVLDIDSKDENGKPLAVIERLRVNIGTKTLPVLIVGDKASDGRFGKALYCESLKAGATASDVIAIVKQKGG